MPASIRVIKIVKDGYTNDEAYTVEFEVEVEDSSKLLQELMKTPYGKRLIQTLNSSKFLPAIPDKTLAELKVEAETEDSERKAREEELEKKGARMASLVFMRRLREKFGDNFVKSFEAWLDEERDKEKKRDEAQKSA